MEVDTMITPYEKIQLMNRGMTVIVRRIEQVTRNPIAQTYATDVYKAREEAEQGSTECVYQLLDLFTERKIETIAGSKTVAK